MVLDVIIKRLKNAAEVFGCITADQICPDTINDMESDHIDPEWSQWGGLRNIAVDVPGWSVYPVTFPQAFSSTPNWLLTSVRRAMRQGSCLCQPSGLKVFLVPCNMTTTGFDLNVDVNISCSVSSTTMDVSWIARTMPEFWNVG